MRDMKKFPTIPYPRPKYGEPRYTAVSHSAKSSTTVSPESVMTLYPLQRRAYRTPTKRWYAYKKDGDVDKSPSIQVAQLLQRDCSTLRVFEYVAKSLKVIQNDTV